MDRKAHVEWCENCTRRKPDLEVGLICGATGRIADFEKTCPIFDMDTVAHQENFRQFFKRNRTVFSSNAAGEVSSTSKTRARSDTVANLPEILLIKNSRYGGRMVLFVFLSILGLVLIPFLKPSILESTRGLIMLSILPAILMLFLARSIFDRSAKITLSSVGIQLHSGLYYPAQGIASLIEANGNESSASKKFAIEMSLISHIKQSSQPPSPWNNAATLLSEEGDQFPVVSLIVKSFNSGVSVISIDQLEYSPKRIAHLIELYKEKGRSQE